MKTGMILTLSFLVCGTVQAADAPPAPAMPDINMKCSDYIAMEKAAGTLSASTGDKEADAIDKKVADYCLANPKASASDAIQKAMGQ